MKTAAKPEVPKKTQLIEVDPFEPDPNKIIAAAKLIRSGGLVAFPTETVYGLGADALNAEAASALFIAKRRPLDNPPIVHVASAQEISSLTINIPGVAHKLMELFWPGPLTLIFERSKIIPEVTVAGLNTVAIRMPRHNVALALIKESHCPIAAPSANLSGRPSPTSAEHVWTDLNGRIDMIIDAGQTSIGVESTVLDLTVNPPLILRPGGTSHEALEAAIGEVKLSTTVTGKEVSAGEKVRSPGMKYRHYAPKAEMVLVEDPVEDILLRVSELAESYRNRGKSVGILATDETIELYPEFVVKSLGKRDNLEEIARNLFRRLREFDSERVDVIIAEGFPVQGLGLAVMNRLRKASGKSLSKKIRCTDRV
jgi:L-threonylcarbamoyladenylate synthase